MGDRIDAGYRPLGHSPERTFVDEFDVTREEIGPGDVVKFICEPNGIIDGGETDALILDTSDEEWMEVLIITGYFAGWLDRVSFSDKGLQPAVRDSGVSRGWNRQNHTQILDRNLSTSLLDREGAERIRSFMDGLSELQAKKGVEPTEPPIEQLVIEALVIQALEPRTIT